MTLGIAILGLACSASKQPVDDVLVEGDGIRITKKDFDQYLAQVPPFARDQIYRIPGTIGSRRVKNSLNRRGGRCFAFYHATSPPFQFIEDVLR